MSCEHVAEEGGTLAKQGFLNVPFLSFTGNRQVAELLVIEVLRMIHSERSVSLDRQARIEQHTHECLHPTPCTPLPHPQGLFWELAPMTNAGTFDALPSWCVEMVVEGCSLKTAEKNRVERLRGGKVIMPERS